MLCELFQTGCSPSLSTVMHHFAILFYFQNDVGAAEKQGIFQSFIVQLNQEHMNAAYISSRLKLADAAVQHTQTLH